MNFSPENIYLVNLTDQKKGRHLNNMGIYPTLGLYSIFSYINENGIQMPFENILDGEIVDNNIIIEKLLTVSKPSLIGFYVNTINYSSTRETSELLKNKYDSNITIVYGGPFASSCPQEILLNNRFVDVIGAGDGEDIFISLITGYNLNNTLDGYYRRNSKLEIELPNKRISHIPIKKLPNPYSYIPTLKPFLDNYQSLTQDSLIKPTVYYFHKNGCDNGCIYCSPFIQGKSGRSRSPKEAWLEYLSLHKKFGVNHMFEVSENIMNDSNWFQSFADLAETYNSAGELTFRFQISPNYITEDFVSNFVKLGGNTLAVGFETMDEGALSFAKNKRVTVENNQNAFDLIKKYNIFLVAFFVSGLPFETQKGLEKTYEFIEKIALYNKTTFLLTTLILPIPGTILWKKYFLSNKYLYNKYVSSNNGQPIEPLWDLNEISKDFIENCGDITIPYETLKLYQRKVYNLNPKIFSSWHIEDF